MGPDYWQKGLEQALSGTLPIDFSDCKAFSGLNHGHQLFVLEYVRARNGAQAAIKAGYAPKSARVTASKLLTKANVSAALEEIKAKIFGPKIATEQEIQEMLTQGMRAKITDILSWNKDNGLVFTKDSEDLTDVEAKMIKKIKVTEKSSPAGDWTETKTEIEIHDPVRCAVELGKIKGLYKDADGNNGKPAVAVQVIIERSAKP